MGGRPPHTPRRNTSEKEGWAVAVDYRRSRRMGYWALRGEFVVAVVHGWNGSEGSNATAGGTLPRGIPIRWSSAAAIARGVTFRAAAIAHMRAHALPRTRTCELTCFSRVSANAHMRSHALRENSHFTFRPLSNPMQITASRAWVVSLNRSNLIRTFGPCISWDTEKYGLIPGYSCAA